MIKNHSRVHGLCGAIHYSTRGTDLGQGKGLMEQGRLSQNRKHFLKYNNLVRTTVIVHNLETDLLRSKEVHYPSIFLKRL